MKDLKAFNNYYLKNLPVVAKITDDFPAQLSYNGSILYFISTQTYLGITGSFSTTGSRISYKDFSGELKYDNILTNFSPGIRVGFILINKKFRLTEENNLMLGITKLRMEESILGVEEQTDLSSKSIQIEPGVKLSYTFLEHVELGMKAGYLIDTGAKYSLKSNKEATLQNPVTDENVKNNWSGIRLGIFIGYTFHK